MLLDHEESIHREGELWSWEAMDGDTATFTPDITPLILAAHTDNYEVIITVWRNNNIHNMTAAGDQDPAGPRRHAARPARYQVRLRGLRRVKERGQVRPLLLDTIYYYHFIVIHNINLVVTLFNKYYET